MVHHEKIKSIKSFEGTCRFKDDFLLSFVDCDVSADGLVSFESNTADCLVDNLVFADSLDNFYSDVDGLSDLPFLHLLLLIILRVAPYQTLSPFDLPRAHVVSLSTVNQHRKVFVQQV